MNLQLWISCKLYSEYLSLKCMILFKENDIKCCQFTAVTFIKHKKNYVDMQIIYKFRYIWTWFIETDTKRCEFTVGISWKFLFWVINLDIILFPKKLILNAVKLQLWLSSKTGKLCVYANYMFLYGR